MDLGPRRRWGWERRLVDGGGFDASITEGRGECARAITIGTPPDAVWSWLIQMGADRGGFYSDAWMENQFGLVSFVTTRRMLAASGAGRVGADVMHPGDRSR